MPKAKLDMNNMLGDTKTIQVLSALEGGLKEKQDLNQVLVQAGISTQQLAPRDLLPRAKNRPLDEERVASLMQSIGEIGVLEDLIARPHPTKAGKYELLAGNHRRESCQRLGILAPTKIIPVNDNLAARIAGATNAHRNQLNALEEADMVVEVLSLELGLLESEIEALFWQYSNKTVDRDSDRWRLLEGIMPTVTSVTVNSFIRHYLPLRKLPSDILSSVRSGKLHYTKAQKLIKLKHAKFDEPRQALLKQALSENLAVNELAERVAQVIASQALSPSPQKTEPTHKVITRRAKSIHQKMGQITDWDATSLREIEKLLGKLEAKIEQLSGQ
jgi:ParB family transcriptional regulator, chromosome partitioning protein